MKGGDDLLAVAKTSGPRGGGRMPSGGGEGGARHGYCASSAFHQP